MRALVVAGLLAIAVPAGAEPPPWLGITYHPDPVGAVVTEVHPGSAAASAGLRRDDVIVAIGGEPVLASDLGSLIGRFQIGDRAPILVSRGGRRLRIAPRLRARPSPDELIHQRLVGYDLPDVAVVDRGGVAVTASDWRGRPLVLALFDARCEPCASAVTALVDRFAATAGDGEVPAIEAWVLAGPDELIAYRERVPLAVTTRRIDRELGAPLLGGLALAEDGAIVVIDATGTIRYAASTTSGELAHDGACRVAARVAADWRAGR